MSDRLIVGLDVGQVQDHTAITVVEDRGKDWDGARWALRSVGRAPLGTPYPTICEQVSTVIANLAADHQVFVAIDATGVGQPIVDLLCKRITGASIHAITITGGDSAVSDGSSHRVPKRDLVVAAQVLLQQRQLVWANGLDQIGVLIDELLGMRVTLTAAGHDRYEHRVGEHDDLVLSLCCALWLGQELASYGSRGSAQYLEMIDRVPRSDALEWHLRGDGRLYPD